MRHFLAAAALLLPFPAQAQTDSPEGSEPGSGGLLIQAGDAELEIGGPVRLAVAADWTTEPATEARLTAEGFTKPVLPMDFERSEAAELVVTLRDLEVDERRPEERLGNDVSDVTVSIRLFDPINLGAPVEVDLESAPRFDAGGQARIRWSARELLGLIGGRVNANLIEAEVTVRRGSGAPIRVTTASYLHVIQQKLIIFVPGVAGSRITVAGGPKDSHGHVQEAYPEWSYFPGSRNSVIGRFDFQNAPISWLACDEHGEPLRDAVRLCPFHRYHVPHVYPGTDLTPDPADDLTTEANVYDWVGREELVNPPGHPRLHRAAHVPRPQPWTDGSCDEADPPLSGPVPPGRVLHYIVYEWPYDWRLRLEAHVAALTGERDRGAVGPLPRILGPPYGAPPSARQIWQVLQASHPWLGSKIVLAGHSTGGLIVRKAMQRLGSRVEKAFFIDVPFWGAPKAYWVFLTGDMDLVFIRNALLKALAPNLPVVYYLAPTRNYTGELARIQRRRGEFDHFAFGPQTGGRSVGDLFLDELAAHEHGGTWNRALERAAARFHERIRGAPSIGWNNVVVFWSEGPSETPGALELAYDEPALEPDLAATAISTRSLRFSEVPGDGTVPSVSQKGGSDESSLVRLSASPRHVPSPNDPQVLSTIVRELSPQVGGEDQ